MNPARMLVGLSPWVLFTVVVNRVGEHAAGIAALGAALVAVVFLVRDSRGVWVNIIEISGVVVFAVLAAVSFAGGKRAEDWVAEYGRGSASISLAAVMLLLSAFTVPFTEHYARESVPREYWNLPQFRTVNRKISLLWGVVVLVVAFGHLVAGAVDPASQPHSGTRPVDILLNWVVPIGLVVFAVKQTNRMAHSAEHNQPATQASLS